MGRRQEAAMHVRGGLSPSQTAKEMSITVSSVRQYLLQQIGEGDLQRSHIVRSIVPEVRQNYDDFIASNSSNGYWDLVNDARHNGFDDDEFRLYLECHDYLNGELYNHMTKLELFIHNEIRKALTAEFGPDESQWWRNGIPEPIRVACVTIRETDPYPPGEPYSYTTFIHLAKIIDKNWQIFHFILPSEYATDKKQLYRTFERLNIIRNAIMHPVKKVPVTDDDFEFVVSTANSLGSSLNWRSENESSHDS